MPYYSDLLAQAKHLAEKEPKRPKQASLRRAVSAAYYSLFHHLVSEAALFMVKGPGACGIRPVFQRAFVHSDMSKVAKSFAGGTVSDAWKSLMAGGQIPSDLRRVASAFNQLQEARHAADYDLTRRFARDGVNDLIEMAEKASETWHGIRSTAEARVFLIALLVDKNVSRR